MQNVQKQVMLIMEQKYIVFLNVLVATVGKNICLHVCCQVKKLMLCKMWKNKCNLNHGKEVHKVILNVYGVSVYT